MPPHVSKLVVGKIKKKKEKDFSTYCSEKNCTSPAPTPQPGVLSVHSHAQLLSHSKNKILHCKSTLSRSFLASAK